MRREKGKLRLQRKFSPDPSFMETLIVVVLAVTVIGLALGLHIWIPLAIVSWFVAGALGYSGWYGLAIVGGLFMLRMIFGGK